ncbi:MAG: flagellar hook-length control protein FliK [Candidatus Thiodiazotropha sp.]
MQIPITQILLPSTTQTSREPLLQNLKPGQILQGTAMSGNIDGRLSLQIGVTRLVAETQLSVRPGQSLTLQVVKTENTPELRVLLPATLESLKATALKTLLPRQQPLPEAFKALIQVIQPSSREQIQQLQQLPPAVREQAVALVNRLPSPSEPGFKSQLQRALTENGLLTESKLLRGMNPKSELKPQLIRLMQRIIQLLPENRLLQANLDPKLLPAQPKVSTETLPDSSVKLLIGLLKHLDGAVARIQTHQLASLPQEDHTRQVWQFDLPIRNGNEIDLFQIRIGREDGNRSTDEDETVWSLSLHMDLADLGPMRVQLRLQADKLSTLIWCERPVTNHMVKSRLNELRTAYEQRGLAVERLETHVGVVEAREALPHDGSLLNEKA